MTASLAIEALNGGEISPLLAGRGSKDFYQNGLKTSLNMLPMVQGPVIQRSGSAFVAEIKDSTKLTALIEFQFNTLQAYILEFGDQYMRVHLNHARAVLTPQNISGITNANPAVLTYVGADTYANGDPVFLSGVLGMVEVDNREFTVAGLNAGANTFQLSGIDSTAFGAYTSGGTVSEIYQIATPYLQADLFDSDGTLRLKFAQTGDTMYIVHPSYAPRKLTRTGHTAWTLNTVAFLKGPFASINSDDSVRIMCTATGATNQPGQTVSIQANSAIFDANMVGEFFYMEELYLSDNAVAPWASGVTTGGGVGSLQVSNNSNVYVLVDSGGGAASGEIAPLHIAGDAWDGPLASANIRKWRYLHSRWAIITLTAFVDTQNMTGTITTYLCDGLAPASKVVTNVTNSGGLFHCAVTAHGYAEGDYVNIAGVTGTGGLPAAVNKDWKITNITTNAFDLVGSTFVGASTGAGTVKRYSTWKWAHGAFSASKGYPAAVGFYLDRLAFANTAAQPDSVWLSEFGFYESFAGKTGPDVLATNSIAVTLASGEVNPINWMSPHTDGLVLGTPTAEYSLQAASPASSFGPGNTQAPLRSGYGSRAVPPARIGATAFFVQRAGRKVRDLGYFSYATNTIVGTDLIVRAEHLTKKYPIIDMAWVAEPDALLWAIRSDGQLVSFTYQKEQEVFAWGQHQLGGNSDVGDTLPPLVESVASIPTPDGRSNELWMIVNRYVNGKTRRYIEYLTPRWIDGDPVANAQMVDASLTYSGAPVTKLSGLYHLIGDTVAILADGKVHRSLVVDATGSITLDYQASTIAVGGAFKGRVQPMAVEHPTQTGTAQGKKKIITKATVRMMHTNNIKYGGDFVTMERQNFVTTQGLYDTAVDLITGDMDVTWPGQWDNAAFLCFENDLPVPFGICAIFPQVETVEMG